MIRCVVTRWHCPAKWFTTAAGRHATETKTTTLYQPPKLSNPDPSTNLRTVPGQFDNGGNGSDKAKDGEDVKVVRKGRDVRGALSVPYKPRDLPLSPFMDPEAIAARRKHKLPKSFPSKTPTLFQQQLAKNPYAQALATPVRQCHVTDTRLPKYFLQGFEVMAHPETFEPWWVPISLKKRSQDVGAPADINGGSSNKDTEADDAQFAESTEDMNTPELESPPIPPTSTSLGPGVYTLSRQAMLAAMQTPNSGYGKSPWLYFMPGATRTSAIARKVLNHTSWRTDMDHFVLKLMRRRVVEELAYLVQRKRGYIAGCVDWKDAQRADRQQGAILWTGKKDIENGEKSLDTETPVDGTPELAFDGDGTSKCYPGHDDPPEFATLTIGISKQHMIPVHNLPILLGAPQLEELRTRCGIFEKEILLLRKKKNTTNLQMMLWKLQGYLGFPQAP